MNYEVLIEEFLNSAAQRRKEGALKYGHLDFETKDLFQEVEEELLDSINYMLFQLVKFRSIKQALKNSNKLK